MQRLEVSCAVRLIYTSLGAKGLTPNIFLDRAFKTRQSVPLTQGDLANFDSFRKYHVTFDLSLSKSLNFRYTRMVKYNKIQT